MLLTPSVARAILDTTTLGDDQCGVRCGDGQDHAQRVDRLAEVLLAGDWVSGAAITFTNEGGTLVDGFHRVQAVIQSGHAMEVPVSYVRAAAQYGEM